MFFVVGFWVDFHFDIEVFLVFMYIFVLLYRVNRCLILGFFVFAVSGICIVSQRYLKKLVSKCLFVTVLWPCGRLTVL